eukprot:c15109_g1_i1 orf=36-281(-)
MKKKMIQHLASAEAIDFFLQQFSSVTLDPSVRLSTISRSGELQQQSSANHAPPNHFQQANFNSKAVEACRRCRQPAGLRSS